MEIKVDKPKIVELIILNDDVTSIEAVKIVLVNVFGFEIYEADTLIGIAMEDNECSLGKYSEAVARNLLSEVKQYSDTLKIRSVDCEYQD